MIYWLCFGLFIAIQMAIPLQTLYLNEMTLKKGVKHLFACAPVDPNDPLRGKFVQLNFEQRELQVDLSVSCTDRRKVYGNLIKNAQGLSVVSNVVEAHPEKNTDFLELACNGVSEANGKRYLQFEFPFNKFYLDEFKAPKVEELYAVNFSDSTKVTYAVIYVYKGRALITDVQTNGKSIIHDSGNNPQ